MPSHDASETENTRNKRRRNQMEGEARHGNNLAGPSGVNLNILEEGIQLEPLSIQNTTFVPSRIIMNRNPGDEEEEDIFTQPAGLSSDNFPAIQMSGRPEPPFVSMSPTLGDEYNAKALITRLIAIFSDKNDYKQLLDCRDNAQKMIDLFQRLLDIMVHPPPGFQKHLIVATQRLAAASGLYPTLYELTNITISKTSERSGGHADVYKGIFRGREVCIKTIRLYRNTDMSHFMKVFSREAILWSQLRHPNLLPFYGVYSHDGRVSFVAPWMENGDIGEYLRRNQTSNRGVLAYDVAQGLEFLHDNGNIHGDLKGANILVNTAGRARLADFGISSISDKEILAWSSLSTAASKGGTTRWQAPELFDPESDEEIRNTYASDIWAWACVAYEIFAGEVPYAHLMREAAIVKHVSTGMRPTQPTVSSPSWSVWGLTEDIWSLMKACWVAQPVERPSVQEVNRRLGMAFPANFQADTLANDVSFSPGEFRELMRKGKSRALDEDKISVEIFERLLNERLR